MFNYREQLSKMRREYRREVSRLDETLEKHFVLMDSRFQSTEEGFHRLEDRVASLEVQFKAFEEQFKAIEEQFRHTRLQLTAFHDELSSVVQTFVQLREDNRETSRLLQGRIRLLEERLTKMLDLVGDAVEAEIHDLKSRVERLEQKIDPAA